MTPPEGFKDPRALAGLAPDAPLVVAFSGGADSTALLLSVAPPVHAVHIHHGIRGTEADRDAAFCRRVCEERDIPFTCLTADVPRLAAQQGLGLETAARNERYRLLEEFALTHGFAGIVTAHHADDQLETLLLHLLRGSGLRGLCGIPAVRALGQVSVIRPLLSVPRERILRALADAGQDYVTDSTNEEPDCTRNRLRLSVLPRLRELAPDAALRAAGTAELLSADEQYLTGEAQAFLDAEGDCPRVAALGALPMPLLVRVLHLLFPIDMGRTHIEALAVLVEKAIPHSALSLPHTTVRIEDGRLCRGVKKAPPVKDYCLPLDGKELELPEAGALVAVGELSPALIKERAELYKYAASVSLCRESIKGALTVRNRRAGDTLRRGSIRKAVRRLEGLAPLPTEVRARMPLLADEEGVLAVPFGGVRSGAAKQGKDNLTVWFWFN